MKHSEEVGIVACNDVESVIGNNMSVHPRKEPVLRDFGCHDATVKVTDGVAQPWTGFSMYPPSFARSRAAVRISYGLDVRANVLIRHFIEGGITL
jgi:hypothetical protein